METTRRVLLATVAAGLSAGCLGDGGGDSGTPSPTTTAGTSPTGTPAQCDPSDVQRPPVVEDSNLGAQGYGTKPDTLTAQSVADYLSDFETAFAWNRILAATDGLTNINVDTIDGFQPEAAGDGFLAGSRIETSYSTDGGETTTQDAYVTNYFVSPGPVYRVETDDDRVDPRDRSDRQLVQCGVDSGEK